MIPTVQRRLCNTVTITTATTSRFHRTLINNSLHIISTPPSQRTQHALNQPMNMRNNGSYSIFHRRASTSVSHAQINPPAESPIHSTHHPDEDDEPYTNDGWLFNQDPNRHTNDPEDRKLAIIWTVTSIAFIGYMVFMMHYKPETSIRRWAREEALERGVFVPPLRPDITDDDEL